MKIGIIGKGGAGKSTLIALLARDHVFSAYEADPLGGLRALLPCAEGYEGIASDPCLIEFPLLEQGFRQLAGDSGIKAVLVTTPHLHALEEAKGVLETLRRYCPNEVLGVVVTQSGRKTAERAPAKLDLKLLGSLPLERRLDDHLVKGGIKEYRVSRRMEGALTSLASKLGLKRRSADKKGFRLFGRLRKWGA